MKLKTIKPNELIEPGTCVRLTNGYLGTVVKSEMVEDNHGLPICLHTIEFTHRYVNRFGFQKVKQVKVQPVNYSFICKM